MTMSMPVVSSPGAVSTLRVTPIRYGVKSPVSRRSSPEIAYTAIPPGRAKMR